MAMLTNIITQLNNRASCSGAWSVDLKFHSQKGLEMLEIAVIEFLSTLLEF